MEGTTITTTMVKTQMDKEINHNGHRIYSKTNPANIATEQTTILENVAHVSTAERKGTFAENVKSHNKPKIL